MRIYGLDVKERLRGENRFKFWRDRVRAYTARNYGAVDRYQIASDTLAIVRAITACRIRAHTIAQKFGVILSSNTIFHIEPIYTNIPYYTYVI